MSLFEFVEETPGGLKSGTIEAINKEYAVRKLLQSGVRLIKIDELSYSQQLICSRLDRLRKIKSLIEPPPPVRVQEPVRKRSYTWILWLIIPMISIFFIIEMV